jgi:hypothetical protein
MIAPFRDLLIYKRKKIYSVAKHRKDSRLNLGFNYEDQLFNLTTSKHIQRNQTIREFMLFLNDYFYNKIKSVRYLKIYKNYTVEKDYENVR